MTRRRGFAAIVLAAFTFVPLVGMAAVSPWSSSAQETSTDAATLQEIATSFGLDIWGAGDVDALERYFAEDVIDHNAFPGQAPGREGMAQAMLAYRAAFPDLTLTNDDIIVGTDRVVLRWTAVGTHEGDLMGIPASGAEVTMTGIDILRVENGKVVERWGEFNSMQTMQQIGAVGS